MTFLELKVPPPVQVLLCAAAMWLIGRMTPSQSLSGWVSLGGAVLFFALGVAAGLAGISAFHRAHTTVEPGHPHAASTLVTTGIYRFTRNPMYMGLLLTLMGWAFYLENVYAALVLPLFMLFITRFQIMPEERALTELFGDAYERYTERVSRWF